MSEHEGMMTRREVLEIACEARREASRELASSASDATVATLWSGRADAFGLVAGYWNFIGPAHELALLMNAEREEAKP
jgi:hypothetical protein